MTKLTKFKDKSPDMIKAIKAMFGDQEGICPTCQKPLKGDTSEFRDDLSRKEYTISGMCQSCQDGVFE